MGYHRLFKHEEHWNKSGYLDEFLSLVRYKQIHRYFTFRDRTTVSREDDEIFVWQVESIGIIIKQNCKDNWQPSSHLAIDETISRAGSKCCLLTSNLLDTYRNRVESASKQLFGY